MLQTTATGSFSAKSSSSNHPPVKQAYSGEREYLRPHEVEELMKAARNVGRHGLRDSTIILLMFRHGLRSGELVALKWSSVDLKEVIQQFTESNTDMIVFILFVLPN